MDTPFDNSTDSISRKTFELLDSLSGLDYDGCWETCLSHLEDLGVNSIFYGAITSRAEVERQGLTKSCLHRTNHDSRWQNHMGIDRLIDNDITSEIVLLESTRKEIVWFDESNWTSATAEERAQAEIERDFGLYVGITVQLSPLTQDSPVGVGAGLSTNNVSTKEFYAYWDHHRTDVLDSCQILDFNMRSVHTAKFTELSLRELEFLTLLAAGYSQKQIAYKWNRTQNTLDKHSRKCRDKLKSGNLEQAVYKAYVLGLIQP